MPQEENIKPCQNLLRLRRTGSRTGAAQLNLQFAVCNLKIAMFATARAKEVYPERKQL
jgi:hypothetical protein